MTASNWSVPETEVVQRVRDRLDADGTDVLATIVDVEGNAYRRPGAKMLLDDDGSGVGSITAGCIEDDLLAAAEAVRETGRPDRVTYDLMEDEDDVWGLGVGCNGVIDVLLEPLTETYRPAVEAFGAGRDVAVLTVLSAGGEGGEGGDGGAGAGGDGAHADRDRLGERAYYRPDEDRLTLPDGSPADGWPVEALAGPAADLAARGAADVVAVEDETGATVEVFVDGLAAPDDLVVFGTGHDVGPVVELGERNDFRVTVVGFRGGVDLDARFPDAHRTVTTSPAGLGDALDLDDRTHAVVMTHNFVDDRIAVEELLRSPAPYVGLMGPRERFEEMLEAYDDEGTTFGESELASLYTPVGLDLGGGTPYQIAHSIVGEVLAVSNDRTPRHLREREGHIHDRVDVETRSEPEPPSR
ncbi:MULTISPECIES: XdhC family protein [unclassified Halorubrum]|uniref:XdhC family protein n=1 Tax=unclassified Halorubrum TaxID=2642239 RepID=UPI000B99D236|nr:MULTISPECIES: XdhC/CoxI family protein [unclassified Halorubrum]OYR44487.1 xanthine dehydrogenase [Halorubrum sp. Eb13]OYR52561.1 xanthine dehydrogenase [Halorubrum sp. Ea8]